MKQVTIYEFVTALATEFGIDSKNKVITKYEKFPVNNGIKKINSFSDSVIVDDEGNEFPYMLDSNNRNNEKLVKFNHIYYKRLKGINQIIKETGANVRTKGVKICEGGGWESSGTQYMYNETYCEQ